MYFFRCTISFQHSRHDRVNKYELRFMFSFTVFFTQPKFWNSSFRASYQGLVKTCLLFFSSKTFYIKIRSHCMSSNMRRSLTLVRLHSAIRFQNRNLDTFMMLAIILGSNHANIICIIRLFEASIPFSIILLLKTWILSFLTKQILLISHFLSQNLSSKILFAKNFKTRLVNYFVYSKLSFFINWTN